MWASWQATCAAGEGPHPGAWTPSRLLLWGGGLGWRKVRGQLCPPKCLRPLLVFPVASSPHHPCSELGLTQGTVVLGMGLLGLRQVSQPPRL